MLRRLGRWLQTTYTGGLRRLGRVAGGTLSGMAFRAQPTLELLLRTGASMRFQPKSLASIDQRPGPNIASAAAMVPANRPTNGCSPKLRSSDISIRATTAPATGVHRPAARRSPDIASDAEVSAKCTRRVTPQLRAGTDKEDRADDQAHDQQTDAGPPAGERGIEAAQNVVRLHYSVVAAKGAAPHGVGGMTL